MIGHAVSAVTIVVLLVGSFVAGMIALVAIQDGRPDDDCGCGCGYEQE